MNKRFQLTQIISTYNDQFFLFVVAYFLMKFSAMSSDTNKKTKHLLNPFTRNLTLNKNTIQYKSQQHFSYSKNLFKYT